MENVLKDKIAVVYGAGSIGGAVAKAFAGAGAKVFLTDHSDKALERFEGQHITTQVVDVLDKAAVADFVQSIVKEYGRVDISFTATSTHKPGGDQGAAMNELSYENFSMPMVDYTKAHFNTAGAVYEQMKQQKSGVIMGITAIVSHMPLPFTAGFGPAWAAVEAMLRVLAAELGPYGVRTVCLHSAGSPGAADKTMVEGNPELDARTQEWGKRWMSRNLLGRGPELEDVGHMAVFMASDYAPATTGSLVSLNAGMEN
jgi:3-oxoacyl-[acyl-carrier protein] reductase